MILRISKYLLAFILAISYSQQLLANETITLKHNDINLNANLKLADGKSLKDDIILMTHGTLAHGKMEIIASLQNLFADNGISSLAITLGLNQNNRSGFYDCNTPHTHKHTDAIDEIDLWMNWLKKQDNNNVVLLGHSRGGNQTAWYAAEHDSPMIRKIILIAPQTWNYPAIKTEYKKKYNKQLTPILNKARALINQGRDEAPLKHTDFIYCKDTTVSAGSFISYYKDDRRMDTPFLINELTKPTLVFIGTEDKVIKGLAEAMTYLSSKPNIQSHTIEGADHSFRDIYADEIIEKSIEFIEE
ncbi:MAG: alpha/beta hydrolase [Gammaproteobacteria bacterium]|nr:alpha/beta hydrolase [Gammaproteobacteria bacterium]MCW9004517.1 alpha/beta hydrolase [Gammaproteobacteria bacterium]